MNKHTPGPWEAMWTNDVGPDDEYYVEFYEILDAQGNRVGTAEEKHDAVLMAEAPKLLEALSMWLRLHETPAGYEGKYGKALDAAITAQQVKIDAAANAARAAIAKATGEKE
jgi:hypothetical protein